MKKITILNNSHNRKLVRCKIRDRTVDKAIIIQEGNKFYLFQDAMYGSRPMNIHPKDFRFSDSWYLGIEGDDPKNSDVHNIVLLASTTTQYIPFL